MRVMLSSIKFHNILKSHGNSLNDLDLKHPGTNTLAACSSAGRSPSSTSNCTSPPSFDLERRDRPCTRHEKQRETMTCWAWNHRSSSPTTQDMRSWLRSAGSGHKSGIVKMNAAVPDAFSVDRVLRTSSGAFLWLQDSEEWCDGVSYYHIVFQILYTGLPYTVCLTDESKRW